MQEWFIKHGGTTIWKTPKELKSMLPTSTICSSPYAVLVNEAKDLSGNKKERRNRGLQCPALEQPKSKSGS